MLPWEVHVLAFFLGRERMEVDARSVRSGIRMDSLAMCSPCGPRCPRGPGFQGMRAAVTGTALTARLERSKHSARRVARRVFEHP